MSTVVIPFRPMQTQVSSSIQKLIRPLQHIVGERYVLTKPEERLVYECDACLLIEAPPEVVVLPANTQEVAQIVQLCHQHQIPFTPRGSGTGLSGGALPIQGGVLIGLNRMNQIREIDPQHQWAQVEAGVINGWLNRDVASHHLFYAPDPSSQAACSIGGNIAENAGGIHCLKYGVTVDHILSLEVVLPTGEVVWLGNKTRRTQGFNLTGLMVGSEGTLGIVTQAVVQLLPKPVHVQVYLASFAQVAHAGQTASDIIASGFLPSALEFMDAFTVKAVNDAFGVGFPEESQAVLLIELDGAPLQLAHEEAKLQQILEKNQCQQLRVANTEAECQKLWAARKGAVAAYGRILPAFYLHDCVIPRNELTPVLARIQEIGERYRLTIGNVFHAGDGNLHPNILFDPNDEAMIERMLQGGEEILNVCLEVGGTLSGEHGIGIEKAEFMDRLFSAVDLGKMQQVKQVFDPLGLANPAKIFPTRKGCGETHGAVAQGLIASGQAWI